MIKRPRLSALTIALAYCVLSLAVLAAFALPLWYRWSETIEAGRTRDLQADMERMTSMLRRDGPAALGRAIDGQLQLQRADAETFILLTDAAHTPLAGNLSRWPDAVGRFDGHQTGWVDANGGRVRMAYEASTLPGGYRLLIGNDLSKYRALEFSFLAGLGGAAIIVLLCAAGGGLLLRRRLLGKVDEIRQTTAAIMLGDLSHRLPEMGGESELNKLVATQNTLLDQIEHLIGGVRSVSDAIAHDLRTPLSVIRARLEELLARRPGPQHTYAGIELVIAELDHVIGIFNALLRLAEIDARARRSGFVALDVDEIGQEVAELYQALAESQGCSLTYFCAGALPLQGDPILLAQAIANLIDNALKYNRPRGHIDVILVRQPDGSISIAVADEGPGIPNADKQRVLERFFRRDASRNTAGVGLGLSVVAAVAKLHGGSISFTDATPGLIATLWLPAPGQRQAAQVA